MQKELSRRQELEGCQGPSDSNRVSQLQIKRRKRKEKDFCNIFSQLLFECQAGAWAGGGKGRLRAGSREQGGVAAPRKAATQNWPIYMRLCFCSTVVARKGRLNFNFEFFFARVSVGETNAKCQSLAGAGTGAGAEAEEQGMVDGG